MWIKIKYYKYDSWERKDYILNIKFFTYDNVSKKPNVSKRPFIFERNYKSILDFFNKVNYSKINLFERYLFFSANNHNDSYRMRYYIICG